MTLGMIFAIDEPWLHRSKALDKSNGMSVWPISLDVSHAFESFEMIKSILSRLLSPLSHHSNWKKLESSRIYPISPRCMLSEWKKPAVLYESTPFQIHLCIFRGMPPYSACSVAPQKAFSSSLWISWQCIHTRWWWRGDVVVFDYDEMYSRR